MYENRADVKTLWKFTNKLFKKRQYIQNFCYSLNIIAIFPFSERIILYKEKLIYFYWLKKSYLT
jgi:hypothetical protein